MASYAISRVTVTNASGCIFFANAAHVCCVRTRIAVSVFFTFTRCGPKLLLTMGGLPDTPKLRQS